ncbi:MAG: glycosyltransferase family 2 protein [Mesorhizobium sp.]|uniref:glycosyltransferase family 2 protein n=1 Tax=unclassified Mesorhizobium TaxID=325217 RepID=UPI000FE63158|nr:MULTISPECIES: glycosyltransferase family A protein [unclassified Mesorhizobium]RWI30082.1 MAG: glycosyltransferase family 2 protein [Mesorhizobium sp.]RWK53343.1 MAG: glycosyltransferase family 2 protein [Mesorhizobium sp.]RWK57670.1 MAG: glycosyltransferase family 2 protein [Mesorhizobium sp.]RWK98452.1 MAG: glycosyltransferase family 2 protein [Mesorhizobium sp.]RWL13351.1 MAG: glycosyltransferase family 2 protein [Mesorhizobium sp.]
MSQHNATVIGVVVPMFNAERTILPTLTSICQQSHQALDIVVVDDGSTDRSASIVAAYAEQDRRIRLLRQPNAGVAHARNTGAAATDAEFLAFVDADDLWAPSKIALQLRVLQEGGSSAGLAYCWFAEIDEDGRIFSFQQPDADGRVLQRMCRNNFVGNGSSMLVRRSAFERAGQFDPSLRARNAQGCEDLLMCLRIAENYEFRVVPQHLVGYRRTIGNMSSDVMQMFRSYEIVLAEFREKYPQFGSDLNAHLLDTTNRLAVRALIQGRLSAAWYLSKKLFALEPRTAISRLPHTVDVCCRGLVPRWIKVRVKRMRNAESRPLYGKIYLER